MSIGQVTYNLEPIEAQPGQLADLADNQIDSYPAGEVINPGRLVALAADGQTLVQVQNTSAATTTPPPALGVAVLQTARQPLDGSGNGAQVYNIGDLVPVLTRGAIFVEWKSASAQPVGTNAGLNVYHSSTVATDRGKFSADAGSIVAGSEITSVPAGVRLRAPARATGGNIALAQINLPGSSA